MARLHKTLADYLVIAISPVLIMTLIGSLVYFLIEVFYRGQYVERLHYIFTLFIIGTVLIGRISIEEGKERAALFAMPMAVAILLAINRFVELNVPFAFFINCGLIGLVWWSAHKLTWDCTVIDETEPDSGEGLLEVVGLDKPKRAAEQLALQRQLEGTTDRQSPHAPHRRLWDWIVYLFQRSRQPHAPGLWVVYFSMAALPLFTFGQMLIPSTNQESRQWVFRLVFVYVASGLGLLLATSFLGLRRYLRQRKLEMPLSMVSTWLGIGVGLALVVMIAALILPRPNAEYAISQMPISVSTAPQKSSPYGWGNEGVPENTPDAKTSGIDEQGTQQSEKTGPKGQTPGQETGSQGQAQSDGKGKGQSDSKGQTSKSDGSEPSAKSRDDSSGAKSDKPTQAEDEKTQSASQKRPGDREAKGTQADQGRKDSDKPSQGARKPQRGGGNGRAGTENRQEAEKQQASERQQAEDQPETEDKPAGTPADRTAVKEKQRQQEQESKEASSGGKPTEPKSSVPKPSPRPSVLPKLNLSTPHGWLGTIAKLLLYGAIFGLLGWWAWRHRAELLGALRELIEAWKAFWAGLFGRSPKAASAVESGAEPVRLPRFADFTDPFLTGEVHRLTPEQVVDYTFQAVEAWGREHGCPRPPDQTPHEFAWRIGQQASGVADDVRRLADLYARAAYASGTLPPSAVEYLRRLWQNLPQAAPSEGVGTAG